MSRTIAMIAILEFLWYEKGLKVQLLVFELWTHYNLV